MKVTGGGVPIISCWSAPIDDVIEHDGLNPDCPCGPVLKNGCWEHRKMAGRLVREAILEMDAAARELQAFLREQRSP